MRRALGVLLGATTMVLLTRGRRFPASLLAALGAGGLLAARRRPSLLGPITAAVAPALRPITPITDRIASTVLFAGVVVPSGVAKRVAGRGPIDRGDRGDRSTWRPVEPSTNWGR